MFKDIFIDLCNKNNVSPTSVCVAIGLSNAAFSAWTDETVPRKSTLLKIANYFGVTPDYLLGKDEKPAEIGELAEDVIVYHRDGKTVTKKFTKEQMDMLLTMIEAIPETKKNI